MATIIQPYNPWAETLAVNTIVPLITDALQRGRNAIQNKKTNLYRQQLQQYIDAQNNQSNLINGTPQPEGYNDNPYAAAFHQTNQPLQQFDMGTANIVPQVQQAPKIPTILDYERAAAEVGANPRFSKWLSPDEQRNAMLGLYNATELARTEQKRKEAAAAFNQAMGLTGKTDALTSSLIDGSITPDTFNPALNGVKYGYPYQVSGSYDDGQTMYAYSFDPVTGTITPQASWNKYLSPEKIADLADKKAERDMKNEQFWATHNEGVRQFNTNHQAGRDDARTKAEQVDKELDIKKHAQASIERQQEITSLETASKQAENALKSLDKEEAALNEKLQDAITYGKRPGENLDTYNRELYNIRLQKRKIRKQQQEIGKRLQELYKKPQPNAPTATQGNQGQNLDLGKLTIGDYKGITGKYGEDRGDHKHAGTDYKMAEGSPIKVDSQMGDNLRVTDAHKSPSYGNVVVIEGTRNGHKVKFRMAHMKDGSMNVKVGQTVKHGDVIGKVGSTGRSTGPHLHLEVFVDGKKVDPEKFFNEYGSNSSLKSTQQQIGPWTEGSSQPTAPSQNTAPTTTSQDVQAPVQPIQPSQTTTSDNDVIWVDSDGNEVSAEAIDSFYQTGRAEGLSDKEIEDLINNDMGMQKKERQKLKSSSAQPNATSNARPKDTSPIVYKNTPLGDITLNDYYYLLEQVQSGKYKEAKNEAELDRYLRSNGGIYVNPNEAELSFDPYDPFSGYGRNG